MPVAASCACRRSPGWRSCRLAADSAWGESLRAEEVRYNRDVLPILAENCFACHGFDKARREAGLRLDSAAGATAVLDSGARAIAPGQPAESALIERIFTTDADERMPPEKAGKQLTAVATRNACGAGWSRGRTYEAHWAFIPPERVEPPAVAADHPIDRFILARLAQEAIEPAPPADRATLVRRLSFDLIGLPPSPLEVDAFVKRSAARRSTSGWSTACSAPSILANAGRGGGSTWRTMPTATAICRTSFGPRRGGIDNGWSTLSIAICRSTGSPSSSLPAICCPMLAIRKESPPVSCATR